MEKFLLTLLRERKPDGLMHEPIDVPWQVGVDDLSERGWNGCRLADLLLSGSLRDIPDA